MEWLIEAIARTPIEVAFAFIILGLICMPIIVNGLLWLASAIEYIFSIMIGK